MLKLSKLFYIPLFAAVCMLLTGCLENGTMLLVNKDGTGKIIARAYMNDAGAGGLGGLGAALGGEAGAGEVPDMTAAIKQSMEKAADSFGEGVELESVKEVKNKLGWKGYEGVYTFKDVTKIKFQSVAMDGGDQGGMSMDSGDMSYQIKFTPGAEATLEVIADLPEEAAGGDAPATGGPSPEDMANPAMMAMMAPMLQGMRMSYMIKVNGEITETNAKHVNKAAGSVLVMDMQMDKLMANQEAMKLLMASGGGGSPDFDKLESLNVDGLKMQNPKNPLKISFK